MPYKIESRQKDVAGIGGHNYLALVDEDGIVRSQIHGHLGPGNRLIFVRDLENPEVEGAAREVVSGTKDEMANIWSRMEDAAWDLGGDPDEPNSRDGAKAVYGLLGPNSNSFWATILGRAGFDYRDFQPNSPNWTPGTGIDLNNPLWWSPEHRWPGIAPTNPDYLDRPQASQGPMQPILGLLSLMDDEDTQKTRAFGLLSYLDQDEADETSTSELPPDSYDRRRVATPYLAGWR